MRPSRGRRGLRLHRRIIKGPQPATAHTVLRAEATMAAPGARLSDLGLQVQVQVGLEAEVGMEVGMEVEVEVRIKRRRRPWGRGLIRRHTSARGCVRSSHLDRRSDEDLRLESPDIRLRTHSRLTDQIVR